jgi:peroxiredoxin
MDMARTLSKMVTLGTPMPTFELPDTHGGGMFASAVLKQHSVVVVMFLCNHCPFVKHVREQVSQLGRDYANTGVGLVAISSNDVQQYPDDSPQKMTLEAQAAGYTFPYLFDETQQVAKAFGATCTPDFFVFANRAGTHELVYRGQLDDSRPAKYLDGRQVPVTGVDLRRAIDAALAGKPVPAEQFPSMGCNIKWKHGNEPATAL